MTHPLVSCIVPVFNADRYVGAALDSIFAQSHRPIEVVVVDDGSTDATAERITPYLDRVRYVYQRNAGPGAARNHGLRLANGGFIAFLDADDVWHPEKLRLQMARLEAEANLDMAITYVEHFWESDREAERQRRNDHRLTRPLPGFVCQALVARRSVFDVVGGFDESLRLGEDADWFARARAAGVELAVLEDVLVRRRMHDRNLSYSLYSEAGREHQLEVVRRALARRRSGV